MLCLVFLALSLSRHYALRSHAYAAVQIHYSAALYPIYTHWPDNLAHLPPNVSNSWHYCLSALGLASLAPLASPRTQKLDTASCLLCIP